MGDPLRVLHVVVNMNRGGAETLLMNLYHTIDRSKIQFDFLTSKEGVFDREIESMGGIIHRIPYITDVGHIEYVRNLNQFFSRQDYKIIHSHMDKMSGIILREAKKTGVPVRIAHSHNTQSEGGPAAKLYKSYAGSFINNATHYFACSNAAAKWLFKWNREKFSVLRNGIKLDNFIFSDEKRAKIREELEITDDEMVIGHVGRFNHQKNHSFLLNIFKELLSINPHSKLILAGDGTLRSQIEKEAKRLQIYEKILFLGIRSDIDSLMQGFDIFVFPSLHEGLPLTLIEAQCAGLPCVISNKVTSEVSLGLNLIEFRNLTDSAEIWAETISKLKRDKRFTLEELNKTGYNIIESTAWLQKFYLSFLEKDKKIPIQLKRSYYG